MATDGLVDKMHRSYWIRLQLQRLLNIVRARPQRVPVSLAEIIESPRATGVVEAFNLLYYDSGVAGDQVWRGVPILKNPCDLWMVSGLIQRLRPSVIIETGTHHGGSAMYYADIARMAGVDCRVITIDINPKWRSDPAADGIDSIIGLSTARKTVEAVRRVVEQRLLAIHGHVLVLLDSDHTQENVLAELEAYSGFVTRDSFIIVEDTIVTLKAPGFGPGAAVQAFLQSGRPFVRDASCEVHLLSSNAGGWLRRVG